MSDLFDRRENMEDVKAEAERLTLQRLAPTLERKKQAKARLDAIPEGEVVEQPAKKSSKK